MGRKRHRGPTFEQFIREDSNTTELIDRIKDVKVSRNEVMVSFDVVSLYPSIPVPEAIKYLEQWLAEHKVESPKAADYITLTKACMEQNVFEFSGQFYNTSFGTAMGNAISPFLANIFMLYFERTPFLW